MVNKCQFYRNVTKQFNGSIIDKTNWIECRSTSECFVSIFLAEMPGENTIFVCITTESVIHMK